MVFHWVGTMVVPRAVSRAPMKAAKNELQMAGSVDGCLQGNTTTAAQMECHRAGYSAASSATSRQGWDEGRLEGCEDGISVG